MLADACRDQYYRDNWIVEKVSLATKNSNQASCGEKMNQTRLEALRYALSLLPPVTLPQVSGRNGEELATDEAAVWKRVLNYRVAKYIRPQNVFETHPGFGLSTRLYQYASPGVQFYNQENRPSCSTRIDLVDIDPFGQPWDVLSEYADAIRRSKVIMVSNGEAYAVTRNWSGAQRFPSKYYGRGMPSWAVKEYIPRLERALGFPCRFFYVFPTTVRSIHSRGMLPRSIYFDCPQWMWWLARYIPNYKRVQDRR